MTRNVDAATWVLILEPGPPYPVVLFEHLKLDPLLCEAIREEQPRHAAADDDDA